MLEWRLGGLVKYWGKDIPRGNREKVGTRMLERFVLSIDRNLLPEITSNKFNLFIIR